MDAAAVALAARVVLAVVLVVAAVSKLRWRSTTRDRTVALLGARAGSFVAAGLPIVECVVAVLLVVWWGVAPGVLAAVLVLAFTAVLVRAQVRQVPCPCFASAPADAPPGGAAVLRNAVLVVFAVIATGSPSGAALVPAVAATIVLGVIATLAVRFGR